MGTSIVIYVNFHTFKSDNSVKTPRKIKIFFRSWSLSERAQEHPHMPKSSLRVIQSIADIQTTYTSIEFKSIDLFTTYKIRGQMHPGTSHSGGIRLDPTRTYCKLYSFVQRFFS